LAEFTSLTPAVTLAPSYVNATTAAAPMLPDAPKTIIPYLAEGVNIC